MTTVSSDTLIRQLQWRYATKKFDTTRKISQGDWATLEQALILAPSSYGLQPWKFFVVDNPTVRSQLRPVSWNQSQITDASHLVVFAVKKNLNASDVERYVQRIVEVRGVPADSLKDYKNMMIGSVTSTAPGFDVNVWSTRQAYIALGQLLTSAALLGIDACPMEGFDRAKYDEILGLEAKGYHAVVLCTLGYRAADDALAQAKKVRFESKDVVAHI